MDARPTSASHPVSDHFAFLYEPNGVIFLVGGNDAEEKRSTGGKNGYLQLREEEGGKFIPLQENFLTDK